MMVVIVIIMVNVMIMRAMKIIAITMKMIIYNRNDIEVVSNVRSSVVDNKKNNMMILIIMYFQ